MGERSASSAARRSVKRNSFGWLLMVESVSTSRLHSGPGALAQRGLANLARLARAAAFRDSMLLLVLAGVWVFFDFATGGTFLTQRNLVLLALQTSIVSLAAISAVMLIVTRNFDLSVGSSAAFVLGSLVVLAVGYGFHSLDRLVPARRVGGVVGM